MTMLRRTAIAGLPATAGMVLTAILALPALPAFAAHAEAGASAALFEAAAPDPTCSPARGNPCGDGYGYTSPSATPGESASASAAGGVSPTSESVTPTAGSASPTSGEEGGGGVLGGESPAAQPSQTAGVSGGTLPLTGFPLGAVTVLGGLIIAAGIAIRFLARRRRAA